jgi:hypothetical protein
VSLLLFASLLALTVPLGFAILYVAKLCTLRARSASAPVCRAGRYRPLLRILSEEDLAPVRNDKKLLRRMRVQRAEIFRGYVRCLSRDYARLLSGLSMAALQSATDRPDLAFAILRSRLMFASTLCRLDVMVVFYRFGVCGVDVSGLAAVVEALSAPAAFRFTSPAALAA